MREVWRFSLGPFFFGSEPITRRKMVPKVDGMVEGKGSELEVSSFWPADGRMDHLGPREVTDGLDEALGRSILVMGPNSIKTNGLVFEGEILLKFLGGEDAIVSLEGFEAKS